MTKLNQTNAYMSVRGSVGPKPGDYFTHIECGETEGYLDSFEEPLVVVRAACTDAAPSAVVFLIGEANLKALRDEINRALREKRKVKKVEA